MTEVYRALQQLHCSWVVRARYQVTIRWPAAPGEVDGTVVDPQLVEALQGLPRVQLGLQLYKVHSNISLLDFQRLEGDGFSCMSLCRCVSAARCYSLWTRAFSFFY